MSWIETSLIFPTDLHELTFLDFSVVQASINANTSL